MININQGSFYRCQHCGAIVEQTFQKGYCRSCLVEHFAPLREMINHHQSKLFHDDTSLKQSPPPPQRDSQK